MYRPMGNASLMHARLPVQAGDNVRLERLD